MCVYSWGVRIKEGVRERRRRRREERPVNCMFLQEWLPCHTVSHDDIIKRGSELGGGVDGEEGDNVKEKRRKKAIRSSIVQELRDEYLDVPEEINVGHVTLT